MTRTPALLLFLSLPFVASRPAASQQAPYRDATLPIDARVADLLSRMTVEEKFWQLYMSPGDLRDSTQDHSHGAFGLQVRAAGDASDPDAARRLTAQINDIQRYFVERTRLGIPIIPFEEAVHGLVAPGATVFPAAIGLAATWDTTLVRGVAGAIADETRSRGIRQVLSPVLNVASDVRWGRVEETYGEDPYLTSLMARAFVGAFERRGVVTTPKHFIANVGDGGRDSYPIAMSDRRLDEEFFPPFEAALDAGARSVMASYNSVDGTPASQDRHLLTDILKGRWQFSGYVISDESAVGGATVLHLTEPDTPTAAADALKAGLDVIFQGSWSDHRPYLRAFTSGMIPGRVIDSAVARVLRVKLALGLFEHPYADPDAAARENGSAQHRALALEAARRSLVLLRNERNTLPLKAGAGSIAVIGTDASEARLGGYSGPGVDVVSILDGIHHRAGKTTRVFYAPGPGRGGEGAVTVPVSAFGAGLTAEYFDNIALSGAPRATRTDHQVDFNWTFEAPVEAVARDWFGARWTGTITAPAGGVQRLGVGADDGYRLYVDGKLALDRWVKVSGGARLVEVAFAPGSRHTLRLEYRVSRGNGKIRLLWDTTTVGHWQAAIDSAVRVARRSAAAVIVAGIEEGEFRDRASLALPGHQEELIRAVAATGVPVTVVLVGGSAITMSGWLDRVGAVLDAWYPGEAGGTAVANVLFGDVDPGGRLPITFPQAEGQLPLVYDHEPTGRGDDYVDLSGQPLFPFGFGLSYTTFRYGQLSITPDSTGVGGTATVRCTVTNSGSRAGDEVVQLYVHQELASLAQPVIRLIGFEPVHLGPGESRQVAFTVGPDQLRMLNGDMKWVVEPGAFQVMVGRSSRDVRLAGEVFVR
ncbi:MAG TPA: glycoside hydrolase family 3 N-terminal domain-containing protein [Gemmatimonadales bacterium]|nr:glycoside hydrolase family 3 N-terminal domain-containing protein [Gemmatimonadales bacterium]